MKVFTVLSSLLVSSVVALPAPVQVQPIARDGDSIKNSLYQINVGLKTLNTTITDFNPVSLSTVGGILDVLKASNQVGNDIIAATNAASASQQLSLDESTPPVVYLLSTLVPSIQSVLANLVSQRSKIDSVAIILSVRKTVLSALNNDNDLQKKLGVALVPKLDPAYQSAGPVVLKEIQDAFDSAIASYSKSMKGIELPAIPSEVKNGKVVNY